ncbi:hypothetical protein E2C01_040696 [Portunus trituberculatus]|uniref:Uncharacterized protein n=1 Tax=Portunus trituberculatus TaxID=210409 RepID=A0A5B7FRG9_PORTR|nr:hypothetical protein [Portunus trituberculatus]
MASCNPRSLAKAASVQHCHDLQHARHIPHVTLTAPVIGSSGAPPRIPEEEDVVATFVSLAGLSRCLVSLTGLAGLAGLGTVWAAGGINSSHVGPSRNTSCRWGGGTAAFIPPQPPHTLPHNTVHPHTTSSCSSPIPPQPSTHAPLYATHTHTHCLFRQPTHTSFLFTFLLNIHPYFTIHIHS